MNAPNVHGFSGSRFTDGKGSELPHKYSRLVTTIDDCSSIRFTCSLCPTSRRSVSARSLFFREPVHTPSPTPCPETASAPSIIATTISAARSARRFSSTVRWWPSLSRNADESPHILGRWTSKRPSSVRQRSIPVAKSFRFGEEGEQPGKCDSGKNPRHRLPGHPRTGKKYAPSGPFCRFVTFGAKKRSRDSTGRGRVDTDDALGFTAIFDQIINLFGKVIEKISKSRALRRSILSRAPGQDRDTAFQDRVMAPFRSRTFRTAPWQS